MYSTTKGRLAESTSFACEEMYRLLGIKGGTFSIVYSMLRYRIA